MGSDSHKSPVRRINKKKYTVEDLEKISKFVVSMYKMLDLRTLAEPPCVEVGSTDPAYCSLRISLKDSFSMPLDLNGIFSGAGFPADEVAVLMRDGIQKLIDMLDRDVMSINEMLNRANRAKLGACDGQEP